MKKHLIKILFFALTIGLSCCLLACTTVNVYAPGSETAGSEESPKASVSEPASGFVFEGIRADCGSFTLTITTVGTDGHYFILDPVSLYCSPMADSFQQTRCELFAEYSYIKFYVRGESTAEIQIPKGEYEIYYATGENWHGEEKLFDKDTVYSKINKTFNFSYLSEYALRIPDGNLSISKIEANEFPN